MIDRFGKDVDFSELFMEETLSAKDKKTIPDDQWGLIIKNDKGEIVERKFPLNDETHVRQAAIFFDRAKGLSDDQKRELARNIVRRAKELDMDYSGWESLKPYLNDDKKKVVKESFMTYEWLMKQNYPDPDSTSGTSDFDDNDHEPDDCYTESLEEIFGPVIHEAFDAITGKEIPIEKAYTMDQMKDITFSNEEAIDERGIQKYLKSAKDTAKKIHDVVERDSKPPTGNQNCLLCTWCSEAAFRGAIKYPRPVYSPRDPVLSIPGESIVHEPRKLSIRGFDNLLEHLMDAEQPFARFYIHINWEGSNGGHEFLILRVAPNRYYVMDSQSGIVDPLTDEHPYFKNINWDNSYICRLDNKNFNYRLFDKMNDPKITLAWNPDKDIPFMEKEGMIHDTCISYAMGVDKSIFELEKQGFIIKEDDGDYCVTFEYNQHDAWENYIRTHIKDTYWNEYIRLMNIDIVFLIKENNKVKRVTNHNYENNPELLATCNRLCEGNFKSIKELIFSNNFYKKNLEGRKPQADVFHRELKKALKETSVQELKHAETMEFYKELKKALGQTPVQEAATEDPMNLLPKDLQEWLKKGDFSKLEKDDSYYYIEGHPIEEFWIDPEFARSAFYLDDKNDPSYNSIVFSDDNGNGLIYDPTDGWYYYLYHDWTEDDTGFLHRERLSSKSWSIIVDPTHIKKFKDQQEKSRIVSEELRNLKSSRIYSDISHASNKYFGKGIFKSDLKEVLSRWYKIGLDWCNDVIDFAEKYDFPKLKEAIEYFENHSIPEFSPSIADAHGWNVEAYREGATKVVAAFNDVEDKLSLTPVQESAIGEILNGVNPFSNKRVFHISQDGHLDGQVFKPRVPEYLDKYDPSQDKFEDVENPRVCFSPSIEGCLNAIMVTIGRWKTAEKLREWYVYVPEKPLKEYKHRTNKQLIKEKKVYDANVTDEIWIEEPVRLKQYGIIRIDQVSSKSIKDTVSTTKGFTGHRYKYSFKWHWLVKPKVIADLPYDYSPKEVCKDMIADMEKYKYGLAENGTVHSASAHDYDTKYKLQSPEEFEQNGGGICYDYVEFMEGYLNAYGYDCKKYFISTNTADNDTHTFLLVRDGKGWKDGFIYPESSFKLMEGVYEVKNYEEAALKIMDKIFDVNHNGEKYDEIKYYVWEYSGHPPYGSDMKTCMEYFSKGDPIHEGTAMKIK